MRHATILVAVLAFVPLTSAMAQVPIRPGARVRVTHLPRQSVGTFLAWKSDTLVFQSNGDTLSVPVNLVTRLDVSRARRLSSKGAAIGALVGGGLGVAAELGPPESHSAQVWEHYLGRVRAPAREPGLGFSLADPSDLSSGRYRGTTRQVSSASLQATRRPLDSWRSASWVPSSARLPERPCRATDGKKCPSTDSA